MDRKALLDLLVEVGKQFELDFAANPEPGQPLTAGDLWRGVVSARDGAEVTTRPQPGDPAWQTIRSLIARMESQPIDAVDPDWVLHQLHE